MDVIELTTQIRKYTKNDLSILTIFSNNDDEITALFLKNGKNQVTFSN